VAVRALGEQFPVGVCLLSERGHWLAMSSLEKNIVARGGIESGSFGLWSSDVSSVLRPPHTVIVSVSRIASFNGECGDDSPPHVYYIKHAGTV